MKKPSKSSFGFTLLEISVAIGITLLMASSAILGATWWGGYRDQLNAETGLNMLAAAQRSYLLDNPTQSYGAISSTSLLLPYLPGGVVPSIIPSGSTISINVYPPSATKAGKTWRARDY